LKTELGQQTIILMVAYPQCGNSARCRHFPHLVCILISPGRKHLNKLFVGRRCYKCFRLIAQLNGEKCQLSIEVLLFSLNRMGDDNLIITTLDSNYAGVSWKFVAFTSIYLHMLYRLVQHRIVSDAEVSGCHEHRVRHKLCISFPEYALLKHLARLPYLPSKNGTTTPQDTKTHTG
jgi:hypothetical protein